MTNRIRITNWYALTSTVLLAVAVILGMLVRGEGSPQVDRDFIDRVQGWTGGLATALQRIGDGIGGTIGAVISAVLLLGISAKLRWRTELGFLLILVALRILALLLKPLFGSPRPTSADAFRLQDYLHLGYPSGHSMTAAMIGSTIALIGWHRLETRGGRILAAFTGIAVTLLVGWSRIWAGAHWPTDVLGGWLFGIGLALLAWGTATSGPWHQDTQ